MDRMGSRWILRIRDDCISPRGRARRECMAKAAEFIFQKTAENAGARYWIGTSTFMILQWTPAILMFCTRLVLNRRSGDQRTAASIGIGSRVSISSGAIV